MSYAEAWLKWFDVIEGGAAPLSARMIELAGIDGACDVLDIGTGIGEPAVSAALAMGGGGHVLAVDRDPEMIAAGRQRAEVIGVSTIDFTVAKIETMALAPDSLDAVLARWSLMFVDDLKGVLTKLAGALRPGGHLAAAAWARSSPTFVFLARNCAITNPPLPVLLHFRRRVLMFRCSREVVHRESIEQLAQPHGGS